MGKGKKKKKGAVHKVLVQPNQDEQRRDSTSTIEDDGAVAVEVHSAAGSSKGGLAGGGKGGGGKKVKAQRLKEESSSQAAGDADDSKVQRKETRQEKKERKRREHEKYKKQAVELIRAVNMTDDEQREKMKDMPRQFTHGWDPNRPWNRLRYYMRHPNFRAFIATYIAVCNFLIYAEDPIAHSQAEAEIPLIGSAISLIITDYPDDHAGLWAFKFFFAILWIVIGMYIGRQWIHHRLLYGHFKLEMFRGDKGTWFVMFFSVIIFCGIGANIFNVIINAWDPAFKVYETSPGLSMTNEDFMKVASSGTWMGDYLTAYMVIDMMLQDNHYLFWAQSIRRAYRGNARVIIFWTVSLALCTTVISVIATDAIEWDRLSSRVPFDPSTSELARAWLASVITLFDLMIVMQDWEFPAFHTNQDINLPGLFTYEIRFDFLKRWIAFLEVHVTGKWFNYGIISIVMMLDMNMLKNQVLYKPEDFAQYVSPSGKIYSVQNQTEIELWKEEKIVFRWEDRMGGRGDIATTSRYVGHSNFVLASSILPAAFGLIAIFYLVKKENPDAADLLRRDQEEAARREAAEALELAHKTSPADEVLDIENVENSDDN